MAPGGRLEPACRHTYETLLLRSRGYGMSKAVLAAVAAEEGLNLTALVGAAGPHAGRRARLPRLAARRRRAAHGEEALLLRRRVLRAWVRLHGRGRPPLEAELRAAAAIFAGEAGPLPSPGADEASPGTLRRDDGLMEID